MRTSKSLAIGCRPLALLGAILLVALPSQVQAQTTPKKPPAHPAGTKPAAPNTTALATASKPFVATGCDASLWKHVYRATQRLKVIQQCIEVTGTIHHVKSEPDGDDHIQLKLDSQFAGLLNNFNMVHQAGCLIVEPVCMGPVTQPDAVSACRDFHSPIRTAPAEGTKVKVLGSFVLDFEQDHGWTEIHPVTSFTTM